MNTVNIVDAISNKQYTAAEEGLAQLLRDKLQSAVIERKDVVAFFECRHCVKNGWFAKYMNREERRDVTDG